MGTQLQTKHNLVWNLNHTLLNFWLFSSNNTILVKYCYMSI